MSFSPLYRSCVLFLASTLTDAHCLTAAGAWDRTRDLCDHVSGHRFHLEDRQYPTLWHQALLTFVQRYKNDMSSEQRELLMELCNSQRHPSVTAEVR